MFDFIHTPFFQYTVLLFVSLYVVLYLTVNSLRLVDTKHGDASHKAYVVLMTVFWIIDVIVSMVHLAPNAALFSYNTWNFINAFMLITQTYFVHVMKKK